MRIKRTLCFSVVAIFFGIKAFGQACNCPSPVSCGECDGEFVSLTLRYNGVQNAIISAADGGGIIFLDLFVTPGTEFTINGNQGNGRFRQNELTVRVNGLRNFTIDTSCDSPLSINSLLGSFTLVAADSKDGGPLCCSPGVEDSAPPSISNCPADIEASLTGTSCSMSVTWSAPTATDVCGIESFMASRSSGDIFTKGTTPVVYTAIDNNGNRSTCTFNVIVHDDAKPVITGCPSPITLSANPSCKAPATWTPPTATDNCGRVSISSTHLPGALFAVGTTTVTYTATDGSGKTASCTFNVIVNDVSNPVINGCPSNITVFANESCKAVATWTPPTTTDCSVVNLTSTHTPGMLFSSGTTPVTYTAVDGAGRTSVCTFTVVVVDKSNPVVSGCPSDIIVFADAACQAKVTWNPPVVTDNCGNTSIQSSHHPGDTFPSGKTEVRYSTNDNSGNTSTCSFNVIVSNESGPAIANCPGDMKVEGDGAGPVRVTWVVPSATIQCGTVAAVSSHQPGDFFDIGSHHVEYTFTDDLGVTSRCTFKVVVLFPEIKVDIGKSITPDGDGVNDEWIISNIEKYKDNKVVIVDRWGSIIFSALGYNNGTIAWKGTNQSGNILPTGTYFTRFLFERERLH